MEDTEEKTREIILQGDLSHFKGFIELLLEDAQRQNYRYGATFPFSATHIYGPITSNITTGIQAGKRHSVYWLVDADYSLVFSDLYYGRATGAGGPWGSLSFGPAMTLDDMHVEAKKEGVSLSRALQTGEMSAAELPGNKLKVLFSLAYCKKPKGFWKWVDLFIAKLEEDGFLQLRSSANTPTIQSVNEAEIIVQDIRDDINNSPIEDSFKSIILYDLEQSLGSYKSGSYKACVVMLGAVLEGVMLATLRRIEVLDFLRNLPDFPTDVDRKLGNFKNNPIYADDSTTIASFGDKLSFEHYRLLITKILPAVTSIGVIGIQNFRNAVHPWEVIKNPDIYKIYDRATAMQHLSTLAKLSKYILSWKP